MRDFRDAKTMAHALRDALKAKAFEITHSESLELIANAFGYSNWNILAAKIEAAERQVSAQVPRSPKTLYCSFCGKSQHEVQKLIAGASAYVCDGCVGLCVNYISEEGSFDGVFGPSSAERAGEPTAMFEMVRRVSSEELEDVLKQGKNGVA